jgi:hypothetical protein
MPAHGRRTHTHPPRRWLAAATAGLVLAALAPGAVRSGWAAPTAPNPSTRPLTVEQSLAQARSSGSSVAVPAATTPTDTLTANPDGTLTLSRYLLPVRTLANGAWHRLDATLQTNSDGSVSPAMTTTGLTLSGGGSGPLVTMANGTRSLGLSLPVALPAPTLSGPTATYPGVLPGVDLQVTASTQGGFSEVLVVHSAAAATNSALAALTLAARTSGLTLVADKANNLSATDAAGHPVFTAPAPTMWDSTPDTTVTPVTDPTSGALVDPTTGQPVASSAAGPGEDAHVASVAAAVAAGGITLTPSQSLFTATDTVYPVFVDPSWSSVSGSKSAWASVSEYYPSTNYYNKTPDPEGEMQVGNSGSMWSHTLINFPISSKLSGATIQSATFSITDVWSYSCTASTVNVYAPTTTLSSGNATWNYWSGVSLGSAVTSKSFAHGYNSSCPAAGENFNVLSGVTAALAAHRSTQTLVLTGVNESSDHNSWKEFNTSSPNLTVTYNHTPNVPTGMSTSPSTACTASPPTTIGDGAVSLYAPVSDPDGGSLSVYFALWKTSDSTQTRIWPTTGSALTYGSGTTAVTVVPATTLEAVATTPTEFSWHVQVSDGIATTAWSTTCNFTFDATRPGAPDVSPNTGTIGQIGQPTTFTVTPPASGTLPSAYLYQLNAAPPITTPADASGNATITLRPTRLTNTLTVTSMSAGGNIGSTKPVQFNSAAPATTQPDADLTGDGLPDALTSGGQNGLPPGLWQARGHTFSSATVTGQVNPAIADIGVNGNGARLDYSPTDFTKAQPLSGHFTGSGLQDVLLYYPTGYTGDTDTTNYGTAVILPGNGDGSALPGISNDATVLPPGTLTDTNGDNPTQLANAGNTTAANLAYPDLIGVSGDATIGYYLAYYPNGNSLGSYGQVDQLDTPTPTGDTAWNNWTITTCQLNTGTAMFLWNKNTGALYLWTNLAHSTYTSTLTYTPYTITDGTTATWNKNTTLTLQAADVNNDGTPDLWTVGANATLTTWTTNNLTGGTAAIATQPGQTLLTGNHAWTLADHPTAADDDPVTTTADATGGLTLTATNAMWNHSDDVYNPDIQLNNGTTYGYLSTTGKAVDTTTDFSVSIWAKPTTTGGTVIAQDGAHAAAFRIFTNTADSSWRFAMTTSDAYGASTDTAATPPGSAKLGVWTRLTATYRHSSGAMNLYLGDVDAATTTHTTTWTPTSGNPLHIGAYLNATSASSSTLTPGYTGEVSLTQTWSNQIVDPTTTNITTPPSSIWGMDDAALSNNSATIAHDAAGLHDATLTTGASWATPGHQATDPGALALNGSTGAATTTGPVLSTNQSFTVTAWVKLTTTGTTAQIAVSQAGTYTHAFRLGYGGNTNWLFRTVGADATNAGGSTLTSAAGTATTGQWTFLTGVWNTTTSTMSLYVNATLISSATVGTPFASAGTLSIGREWNNSAYDAYLGGQADDVRTYQTALTPTDIATIATLTPANATYHLDDATGTTAHDAGALHDATLTSSGASWTSPGHHTGDPGALAVNDTTGAATTTGPVLSTNQSFTVTAWVKLTTTGTTAQIAVSQAGTYTHAFRLGYGGNTNWLFRTVGADATNAGGSTLTSAAGTATTGQWTFLTGVWNTTTSTMSLYVNATLISSATVGTPFASAGTLSIGREWNNSAYDAYLGGQADEVRTYQTALTPTDIQNLYTNA